MCVNVGSAKIIFFIISGEVRRQCNLMKDGDASWGEPDYSRCLSSEFLSINNKVSPFLCMNT